MLAKRVIPCLDVHAGRVTRGQQFGRAEENGLRNVGDPVELAVRYNEQGADELVFFDITASSEGRKSILEVIERTADRCFMPLTVGGGVRSVDDMRVLLRAGADKISLNSAALARPEIISEGAEAFGNQCMVVSIDAKKTAPGVWSVFARGGREQTKWEARAWAARAVELGAGEIVLNSIDADGMHTGYDLEITRLISEAAPVPVVASGGAGELAHFSAVLEQGKADAVLAASVFHYGTFTIGQVKDYLASQSIPVRR
jgi:cyclase